MLLLQYGLSSLFMHQLVANRRITPSMNNGDLVDGRPGEGDHDLSLEETF